VAQAAPRAGRLGPQKPGGGKTLPEGLVVQVVEAGDKPSWP
jgi:hypothetical protein